MSLTLLRTALLVLVVVMCGAIAAISARYLYGAPDLSEFVFANAYARPWLTIHVAGSLTALALVPWQLIVRLRQAAPALHRWIGRAYVLACACGGLAGLILALGTTHGPIAGAGFALLALAWLGTTALGWRDAVARRYQQHRRWMIRSFALAFAAVTLRLYLPLAGMLELPFDQAYIAIAWLCWVPNLLVAEAWLRWRPVSSSASTRT